MVAVSVTIACPDCGAYMTRTVDSRANEHGVRRRRECANGHRFTTQEMFGDVRELERPVSKNGVLDLRLLSVDQRQAFQTLYRMALARAPA